MKNRVVLHDAHKGCWLHFHSPVQVISAERLQEVMPALAQVEELTKTQGLHAAGFITYEASGAFDESLEVKDGTALPLVWFGIYERPEPMELPPPGPDGFCNDLHWEPAITPGEYSAAIRKIKEHLRNGDTCQVNYTFRMKSNFPADPWPFFVQLAYAQQARYACFIDTDAFSVCSASPELFFELEGETITSLPMKGTAPRGLMLEDDLEQAGALFTSEKNRAENLMITDMVRNDMGRLAQCGSVKVPSLFKVEKYPTLWQMTSTVTARTEEGLAGIMSALFPPASITGAPKTRTMRIIKDVETTPRGLYTGCIGFVSPGRRAQFNVAIRTVVIDRMKNEALYGVGGGIVWDSVESQEFQECLTKTLVLKGRCPEFSLLESMLWTNSEGYFLLDEHLERMKSSAAYFDFPFDRDTIVSELGKIARTLASQAYKVRILLARDGRITLNAVPFNPEKAALPPRIRPAEKPVDETDVFLYHKTTNRRTYDVALSAFPGYDDVLLFNTRGEITESCVANVVVDTGDGLFTPPVECGLLNGVYRSKLIRSGEIRERVLMVEDLKSCSHIYLINSVRKMREVTLE
jgi:para-aminobenzoate synthetase / 4-amino-4-deoxychorismate lyase